MHNGGGGTYADHDSSVAHDIHALFGLSYVNFVLRGDLCVPVLVGWVSVILR